MKMSDLAPMREQVYSDPRPKEYFDRFHERARTREPNWIYEATRLITSLYAYTLLRVRSISSEKVPGRGPVILAPNHFSFMDHFLMGCYIRRKVRFMAKSQLFTPFPMQHIYSPGGVFPVRRGARDDETFITAEAILASGGAITMYCEGDARAPERWPTRPSPASAVSPWRPAPWSCRSRSRGPRGFATGSACASPRSPSSTGSPCAGTPVEHPTRAQQQAVADEILAAIRVMYTGLETHGRKAVLKRVRARAPRREDSRGRLTVGRRPALHVGAGPYG